ncbi:efflux RND transporter periplasmic adaptor subunit [Atribacter laminatus]|jgi:HlyD family secretion protein|uniref:Inner membrane protein YibH n=1 Tax=Atribacter laminatus TaxID=2847778 RepID=A0A7T1AP95_ATRLM|nr:efflux RND transporter periplasmic adaptor subunit [Atribacter laminatus]QPM69567.1 Inner membrane protein YibH [Atribacter laminatus]
MRKYLIIVGLAIILLVGYFYQQNRPIPVKGYLVTKKDITETIVATGRIDLGNRINMAFQVGGIVDQLFVQEGQQVKAGDPLIELEDSAEKNRLELAKVNYDLALAFMKSKENEVLAEAREIYNQAKINSQTLYDRYLKLYSLVSIGGSSQNEVNNARSEWEVALSKEASAKTQLESLSSGGAVSDDAKARVEQARLQIREAEIALEQKILLSPIEALVYSISKNKGEYINPGETAISIGSAMGFVVADIDEKEHEKIKMDLDVFLSSQAEPNRVYKGKIDRISPSVNPQKGTIEIRVRLDDENVSLKPDAAMTVEIVINETKGVPAIPRSFLVEKEDGHYVWTDQEGKATLLKAINKPLLIGNYAIIDNLPEEAVLIEPGNFREGKNIQVEMLTSD